MCGILRKTWPQNDYFYFRENLILTELQVDESTKQNSPAVLEKYSFPPRKWNGATKNDIKLLEVVLPDTVCENIDELFNLIV